MKKYILLAVLALFSVNGLAMSFSHASDIYLKIARANGLTVFPHLNYDPSPDMNAYSGGFRITINQGMLSAVSNDHQMALVLGHELAHYKLGHPSSTPSREFAADRLGASLMARAGYNKCMGAALFLKFNKQDTATHPSSSKRIRALGC